MSVHVYIVSDEGARRVAVAPTMTDANLLKKLAERGCCKSLYCDLRCQAGEEVVLEEKS